MWVWVGGGGGGGRYHNMSCAVKYSTKSWANIDLSLRVGGLNVTTHIYM